MSNYSYDDYMDNSIILLKNFLMMFTLQTGRYFLFAGLTYLMIWKWNKPYAMKHRTQSVDFQPKQLFREIKWSILTNMIFATVTVLSFWNYMITDTLLTSTRVEFTWITLVWLLGLILFHDTYFYWMHRLIHHPKLYRWIHRTHHLSTNPSPWAALSFSPSEAILEALWTVPLIYLLNPNPFIMLLFSIIILFVNVIGHSGVQIYPASWRSHSVLKYILRPEQHNEHHHYFKENFGLYFSFWDRWMGTLREPALSKD